MPVDPEDAALMERHMKTSATNQVLQIIYQNIMILQIHLISLFLDLACSDPPDEDYVNKTWPWDGKIKTFGSIFT